jgi:flagellar motor protein MotB
MISPFSRQAHRPAKPAPNIGAKPAPERSSPLWSSDDANWWMITLSDLTLLLLGFVVAWYATEKRRHVIPQPPPAIQSATKKPPVMVTTVDDGGKSEEWKTFQNEMERFIADAGLAKDVSVESTQTDLLVSLRDTVPFASGKAELRAQALPVLEKVISLVLSHPLLFLEISGHTDGIPIATGAFPSNWELSAARASRVARYLIEKGIHPSRIAVQGYANQRPKVPESNIRNRRANRRVEIRLNYGANGDRTR